MTFIRQNIEQPFSTIVGARCDTCDAEVTSEDIMNAGGLIIMGWTTRGSGADRTHSCKVCSE